MTEWQYPIHFLSRKTFPSHPRSLWLGVWIYLTWLKWKRPIGFSLLKFFPYTSENLCHHDTLRRSIILNLWHEGVIMIRLQFLLNSFCWNNLWVESDDKDVIIQPAPQWKDTSVSRMTLNAHNVLEWKVKYVSKTLKVTAIFSLEYLNWTKKMD